MKNKVRICLISYAYPYPRRGYWIGVERSVEELANALTRKGAEVYVVTSYCLGGKQNDVTSEGVRLVRAKSIITGLVMLNLISFSYYVTKEYLSFLAKFDVLHIFCASYFHVGFLHKRLPATVGHHFHTPLVKYLPFPYLFQEPLRRYLFKCTFRGSDIVAVEHLPGSPEFEEFRSVFKVERSKIRFMSAEGVNTEMFRPDVDAVRIKEKFGPHMVLSVGPWYLPKGYEYMFRAMPKILKEVKDAKFVFVGEGPDKRYLQIIAKVLGIEKSVFFEGFVPDEVLPKYYAAACVYVFPSLREGMPLLPLESMACGTPVVGSNLPIVSYEVGDAGILVNPTTPDQIADGVIRLLKDDVLREELSKKGLRRVRENFTWDITAEKMLRTYEEAITLKAQSKERVQAKISSLEYDAK